MVFHSRKEAYRNPCGAVEQNTPVHFRLCVPRGIGCREALLRIHRIGGDDRVSGLFWAGMCGDYEEWWECHFAPEATGLYEYDFMLHTDHGTRFLSDSGNGEAQLSEKEGVRWQLTGYEQGFKTPDWLKGGVIYQIFPDRFAASGEPKQDVPADRVLRDDWGGQPFYKPDGQGVVRNNDFFGGDLRGIEQRLDRLAELGVTCLYLNPIFESHSNHRYDTADYTRVDPLLGTQDDFSRLCRTCASLGIRVILDGVFSHTGADSRYFNKEGRYDTVGAYQSLSSPYTSWYHFADWPRRYHGWWGFPTLPEVDENSPVFRAYILGENGVVRSWLRAGAAGWRLDVADELPDTFLDALRESAKAEKPDALILGEVWEDASNKQSYGHLRRYLTGRQLDSVMNYPFAGAILSFVRDGDAAAFENSVGSIAEHYPPPVLHSLMNILDTHDTARALTALAGEPENGRGRDWQAVQELSEEQYLCGITRLKLASVLQYCLPGVPSLYYGDEAGMQGYRDPFNRGCYPWGAEDRVLLSHYRMLGKLRHVSAALKEGVFQPVYAAGDAVMFERHATGGVLLCAVNRGEQPVSLSLPAAFNGRTVNMGTAVIERDTLHLPPLSFGIVIRNEAEE